VDRPRPLTSPSTGHLFASPPVGSREPSDGVFVWPEGLLHDVRAHKARLPRRFVDNCGRHVEAFEDDAVDDTWSRGIAGAPD
jgi:hypothetical protein